MNLTLTHRELGWLIFCDDESLSEARSIYIRSPFAALDPTFTRRIIPQIIASSLETSPVFHVQIIETSPRIFILWRKEDWFESVTKRHSLTLKMLDLKIERAKDQSRKSRLYRIAVKLSKISGANIDLLSAQLADFLTLGEDSFRTKLKTIEQLLNKTNQIYEPPSQDESLAGEEETPSRVQEIEQGIDETSSPNPDHSGED